MTIPSNDVVHVEANQYLDMRAATWASIEQTGDIRYVKGVIEIRKTVLHVLAASLGVQP